MIGFEVSLNGNTICTAGVEGFGVLTAIVSWVRRRAQENCKGGFVEEELMVEVDGLDSDDRQHLKWLSQALQVDDSFSIRVVNIDIADPPTERYRDDPEAADRAKRAYCKQPKKEYGD